MPLRLALCTLPGPGEAAVAALRAAGHRVVALVLDPRDTGTPLAAAAAEGGAEILAPGALDGAETIGRLTALRPDVVAVCGFDRKIPPPLRGVARQAAVNVHPSLLPAYRGHNPYFWVLARGETETGVTVHHLTDRFDAGPVARRARHAIAPDETLGTLYAALSALGARVLVETLAVLEAQGGLPAEPQADGEHPRAPRVRPDVDCRLDWTRPAADLERLIRASNPFYGATGTTLGVPVQVWESDVAPEARGAPGEWFAHQGRLAIGTGAGALLPRVLGIPGEFIGSAEAFVRRCTGRAG